MINFISLIINLNIVIVGFIVVLKTIEYIANKIQEIYIRYKDKK